MGKTKIGIIKSDHSDITKNRGHDYGAGRAERKHKHRHEKRAKQKLREELQKGIQ